MLVRQSKTELDHERVDGLIRETRNCEFEQTYATKCCRLTRRNIAMAIKAGGTRFCKVTTTENGKSTTRRIHTMKIQAADGRLHHITGKKLPDSIDLYSGVPYAGAHLAEVFLNPKHAKASPSLPTTSGWVSTRDAFFLMLGMFVFGLIFFLSEHTAIALS